MSRELREEHAEWEGNQSSRRLKRRRARARARARPLFPHDGRTRPSYTSASVRARESYSTCHWPSRTRTHTRNVRLPNQGESHTRAPMCARLNSRHRPRIVVCGGGGGGGRGKGRARRAISRAHERREGARDVDERARQTRTARCPRGSARRMRPAPGRRHTRRPPPTRPIPPGGRPRIINLFPWQPAATRAIGRRLPPPAPTIGR